MNEWKKIEDRLKKKELEVMALEEQIKAARVYIQALQDVLKMLPKPAIANTLRSGSAVALARNIIIDQAEPVHIATMLDLMKKEPSRENRASLTSSLAAYVRRGEVFTRPAPNTFGLIELGHTNTEDAAEPPPNFGSLPVIAAAARPFDEDDEIPF